MNIRDLLRTASRTFAIGIERLPGTLCEATTIAYLLLRVSDYLEDNEEMDADQKVELLNLWVNILREEAKVETLTRQFTQADTTQPRRHRSPAHRRDPAANAVVAVCRARDHRAACYSQHPRHGTLDKIWTQCCR